MREFKLGYCMVVVEELNIERYMWLKELSDRCERFILGIPDKQVYARLFGSRVYNVLKYEELMMSTGWFEDVMVLSPSMLRYPVIIDKIHPDVIFVNGDYGIDYINDCDYALQNNVKFVSLRPETRDPDINPLPIIIPLKDVQRRQKIVLFGTGDYFESYLTIYPKFLPDYAVSDKSDEWETFKDGIEIKNPLVLNEENPKDVLVIICSEKCEEIKERLLNLEYYNYRILRYKYEIAYMEEFGVTAMREMVYLKDSRRILTELMEEFDIVCRENDIHYYVICGSLIGVVRHKGMIPWDDDLDLTIPRKDFNKLRKIAKHRWGKDNKKFRFVDYTQLGGGAFYDCMPRLYYMEQHMPTRCFDKVVGKASTDMEDRLFLDLYVMDNAHPNNEVHSWVTNVALKGIYNLMMGHRGFIDYLPYEELCTPKEMSLMKTVHKIGHHIPLRFLAFWYERFSESANWNTNSTCYFMKSVPIMAIDKKYDKSIFGEGIRMPFENIEVTVPSDYDALLRTMGYGSYMSYPAMHERKPSHYFNTDIDPAVKSANKNGICGDYINQKITGKDLKSATRLDNDSKEALKIPQEWLRIIEKPDGSLKKIILYYTDISELLKHYEDMLEKIQYVLGIFEENKDEVALIWRPIPFAEDTIKLVCPWLWNRYKALVDQYLQESWGIYDDTDNADRAFRLSDGYYGDKCSLVQLYLQTDKPVMIQNVGIR